jgi:predicted PurR-regulated permease PerM
MTNTGSNNLNYPADRIAEYGFVISAWRLGVAFVSIFVATLVAIMIFSATLLYNVLSNQNTAIGGLQQKVESLDPAAFQEAKIAMTDSSEALSQVLNELKTSAGQITNTVPVLVGFRDTLQNLTASLDRFNAIVEEGGKLDATLETLNNQSRALRELRSPEQEQPDR